MSVRTLLVAAFALLALAGLAAPAGALDRAAVEKLVTGDSEEKLEAIGALVAEGDPRAIAVLAALGEGELQVAGKSVLIVKGERGTDALTGAAVAPLPADREDVVANNRVRGAVTAALAALRLVAPERQTRLAAARALAGGPDETMLPLVRKALEKETDPRIKQTLELAVATIELKGSDPERRRAAVRTLRQSSSPSVKTLLLSVLERDKDGSYVEPDEDLRREAQASLAEVEGRLAWGERLGLAFAGISLGSILLLAALGLAITYGLMGVINMAHGELIMIGAYATYVVQNLFRAHLPGAFDWYLACAVPVSFAAAAAVGMALERLVIRFLYGRPLETLLATWGIGLILIQAVRTVFGAQNVGVENPAFMSGGIEVLPDIVLPWSRIVIIAFAGAVLAGMALLLTRTRLGLFVRGVTQNRAMAACVGVPTARVDTWAFGLGAGIAGLAGCALSQIGNVGPDLGQAYIVDSFMVVVLGGVGQLAGTVYAALGLGVVNKLIESWQGAVIAKILVLVFIVVFIQKRPQGMFAVKGRAVEGVTVGPTATTFARLYGLKGWIVLGAVAVLLFVVVPVLALAVPEGSAFHVSQYWVTLSGKIMCYAIVALAMDLIWGYCGILSLGHGLFFALGGYAMGMHLMRQIGREGQYQADLPDFMVFLDWKELPWHWWNTDQFWWAALLVVAVPGALAYVFGYFAFRSRVKGVYFSIITQALTFAAMLLFFRNETGFGGNNGFTDFKRILGFQIATPETRMALFTSTGAMLIGTLLLGRYLVTSKFGRVLAAIRDAEQRIMFCGYNPVHYKLAAWTLSAVLCGIAGALYVPQVGIINPSEMSPANSIEIAIWVAVGGRGTLVGAAVGAGIVNGAKSFFTQAFPEYWLYFLGLLFILVTLFLPQGVVGLASRLRGARRT